MSGQPVSDEELQRMLQMAAQGMSCYRIARELGRSQATVSRRVNARQPGAFDRTQRGVPQATEARTADLRERRARAAERLAEDAERIQAQLFAPAMMRSIGGRENVYTEHQIPQPDFHGQLEILRAAQTAWTTSMKLVEFSQGEPGEGARSLLGQLGEALSAVAEGLPPEDDGS
jgi:predicted transcriptional regulator